MRHPRSVPRPHPRILPIPATLGIAITLAFAVAAIVAPTRAWGLAGDHHLPDGKVYQIQPTWSPALVNALNSAPVSKGGFVNASDWFDYDGNPAKLNTLLEALRDHPETLVTVRLDAAAAPISTWRVWIHDRGWYSLREPDRYPEEIKLIVEVIIPVGDKLPLHQLDIPREFECAAGEKSTPAIDRFVWRHNLDLNGLYAILGAVAAIAIVLVVYARRRAKNAGSSPSVEVVRDGDHRT